jgi:hypothetical protein
LLTWFDYLNVDLDTARYYLLAGVVPVIPILLLTRLDPGGVERKKLAEREALAPSPA